MNFEPLKSIYYQLYLLQLENYHIARYFRVVRRRLFSWNMPVLRQKLIWTSKMKLVLVLAFLLHFFFSAAAAKALGMFWIFIPVFFIFSFFYFIFLVIAVFLISPVFNPRSTTL